MPRALAGGLWVVRLRAPFDREAVPERGLRRVETCRARDELEVLLGAAAQAAAAPRRRA